MYHGSHHYIEKYIQPHISFDGEPLVYATDDYNYALVRAGKFDPNEITIKEDYQGKNHIFTLVEIVPDAFRKVFDTSGFIYTVEDKYFIINGQNEFVSPTPVPINEVILIPNVYAAIQNADHFNLIYYDEADEYWTTVRGGKEGYLKRRSQRAALLKEIRSQQTT